MGRKNVFGGNKAKKLKRAGPRQEIVDTLDTSQDVQQMYGQITDCINVRHYNILCTDNKTYLGRLCGKMKRGKQLPKGIYVVVSLRDFEGDKKTCDVMAHAKPPQNIIEQFKINNPVKYDVVDFCNSDDEEADSNGFIKMEQGEKKSINFDDMTGDDLNNAVKNNFNDKKFNNRNNNNSNSNNNINNNNSNSNNNNSNSNNNNNNNSNSNNNNSNSNSKNNSNNNKNNTKKLNNIVSEDVIYDEDDSENEITVKVYEKDKFGNDIIDSDDSGNENNDENNDDSSSDSDNRLSKSAKHIINNKIAKKNAIKKNVILYDQQEDTDEINFDDI